MKSLNKPVLKLNKNWQVIGECTVRNAFEDLAAGSVTALYFENDYPLTCTWNDWINLPVLETDDYILGTNSRKIKSIRVIICVAFDKLIVKPPKLTLRNLRNRDKDTCIYTGKKLKPSEMSIEHIVPTSKNGKNIWENVALAHRDVNSKRGNKDLEDAGLTPRFKPFAPRGKKPDELIENKNQYPEWEMFLKKDK